MTGPGAAWVGMSTEDWIEETMRGLLGATLVAVERNGEDVELHFHSHTIEHGTRNFKLAVGESSVQFADRPPVEDKEA